MQKNEMAVRSTALEGEYIPAGSGASALRTALGIGLGIAAMASHAAADVTAITGVLTDVGTVAAAVFGVYVAIKAAKFIRHAL